MQLIEDFQKRNQELNPVLSQNNFFTKDFDNEKTDDVLEKLKNQTATASDLK